MREPARLAHALGPAGFVTFQLLVGGTVLSALVHPLFIGMLAYGAITGRILPDIGDATTAALLGLFGVSLASGYLTSAALGLMGLARRRLLGSAWVLLLMPLHWLLLSLAVWRALYQLLRDPHRWEKTAHGLARTSRLAEEPDTTIVKVGLRSTGAGRRRHPRAGA